MDLTDEYKYGFLIGIIEGEGHIGIQKQKVGKGLLGQVVIVNTDKNLIDVLDELLKSLNFKYTIRDHHTAKYVEKTGNKIAWRITITNQIDFLKILSNYKIENSVKRGKLETLVNSRTRKIYKRRM